MIEDGSGPVVTGDVPTTVAGMAWARVVACVTTAGLALEDLRLRLSEAGHLSGLVLAQANATAGGRRIRVQAAGVTCGAAVDAVCERLRVRVAEAAALFPPRPWPEPTGDLGLAAPEAPGGLRGYGRIVRVKPCPLVWCQAAAAAATLDAMDYRAHLFIDPQTEQEALVYHAGPRGYRLAHLTPAPPPRGLTHVLACDPRPAPALTRHQAVARLEETGLPHLLFTDPDTGRGQLLYRRFDGHYALVKGT